MFLVQIEECSIVRNGRSFLCMNQSMDRLQYQNEISVFISTAIFFRCFMVAVDFI